ncbi:hypothetical protein Hesp01_75430 [Herbidospora sp. NBRC 101105]|nr:hypothetical protein Hesp01_75430 [Herbidospora sp. NBRC 101105]
MAGSWSFLQHAGLSSMLLLLAILALALFGFWTVIRRLPDVAGKQELEVRILKNLVHIRWSISDPDSGSDPSHPDEQPELPIAGAQPPQRSPERTARRGRARGVRTRN